MKKIKLALLVTISILLFKCSSVSELTLDDEFNVKTESFKENIFSFNKTFGLPQNTKIIST
ncbi:MAG TPA: hypothetical protein VF270_06975, partial [Ignavibacteriaceae bacterium]